MRNSCDSYLLRILFAVVLLCVVWPCVAAGRTEPKREMRGVWIATVWGIDWPSRAGTTAAVRQRQQREMAEILDRCKALNMTTVCFQVRGMADAMYRSSLEPWSASLSGTRGADPGWDPLQWVVDECHARGLECYAWVNPFRWSSGSTYSTAADREWRSRGWLLTWGKYTVFNPGLEEARAHIVDVCREIVSGYDVDGLVFDDYFYPQRIPETEKAPDYKLYRSQAPWMSFGDWRRANVHKTIADVRAMISDTKPWVRLGVSPAGVAGKDDTSAEKWGVEPVTVPANDWQYAEIYSDPLGLMYQGTIDFVSPQIYWSADHATAPYEPLARWWSATASTYDTHVYPSVTLERMDKGGTLSAHRRELLGQIDANRRHCTHGEGGTVIYSAKFLPRVSGVLWRGPWSRPVLMPRLRRHVVATDSALPTSAPSSVSSSASSSPLVSLPTTVSSSVSDLRIDSGELLWNSPANIRRCSVYAVPRSVAAHEAVSADGDGIDVSYLLGVAYGSSFKLPSTCTDCRYAVCVLDDNADEGVPVWLD